MRSICSTSPRVAYLVLALAAAASPVAAQEGAATTGRGAPDPCTIVTETDAGAIANAPMTRRPSEAETSIEAVRTCTYYGKAPSGGGAMLLRVVTYRCVSCEPADLVRRLDQNDWGTARFKHEPDLGPLTTSLVTAAGAQVMGFKGPTGLTVYLGAKSSGVYPLTRRGFAMAMKRMP